MSVETPSETAAVSQRVVDDLTDAVADATRSALDNIRNEWRRERELIEAQAGKTMAEMRAGMAEFQANAKPDLERRVEQIEVRLAISDDSPVRSALIAALGKVIANERRKWRTEREQIEAEARQSIAAIRAEFEAAAATARAEPSEPAPAKGES